MRWRRSVTQIVLNTAFRMFPDSAASQGKKKDEGATRATPDQMAMSRRYAAFTGLARAMRP